ncbi:hypothetical protein HG530_003639 [Fusarium avenaceum]|nr:hypothetical protein HG530_003639 [Fusarium avenaceum]
MGCQLAMDNSILLLPILFLVYTSQNVECSTKSAFNTKLDVSVQSITNHTCSSAIELELSLDGIHHSLAGLSERQGLYSSGMNNRDVTRTCAEKELVVHRQCRVNICSEERGSPLDVVHSVGIFEVVDVIVKASENNSYLRVKKGAISDTLEIVVCNVPSESLIRASDMGDTLRVKFLLYSCLSDDKDLVLTLRKLHDTGDVDGGRVAGAEYIILLTWDSEANMVSRPENTYMRERPVDEN